MRIATFNILAGRTPGEPRVDAARFAGAVAALDADVLALQEVDRAQPRSGLLDLAAVAAEAMGAVEHRFVAALSGLPGSWGPATGTEDADEPAYGIALLSRHPVRRWRLARLGAARYELPHWFRGQPLPTWVHDEQRVALEADVDAPTGRLRVVATHLSVLPGSNGRQLRELMRGVRAEPAPGWAPTVLVGDLNMSPRRAGRITRLRRLVSGRTFPSHRPNRQLDHILSDADLPTVGGGPVALEVSDHRALAVDLAGRPD